jgi:rhamnose utilization protein RhaD (predicted bifunctional aldolase and dehydrogenase)
MSLNALIELSRYYGSNPDYVLAGGGNTSWKDTDTLYVKASGFSLAQASPESFVRMDRKSLAMIWEKTYPESSELRESAVLADMMAAKHPGEGQKRPSVEALLHDIIPFAFVVHLHPALVNGLTCSRAGEEAARNLFSDMIWIPLCNPGYTLAVRVKNELDAYYAAHGGHVPLIFLQNHGVFAGADTPDGIMALYDTVMSTIRAKISRAPDFSDEIRVNAISVPVPNISTPEIFGNVNEILPILAELAGAAAFMQNNEIAALVKNRASFAPVCSAFTPDHIVYAGSDPLFTEASAGGELRRDWENHVSKTGIKPKIIAVQGVGVFGAAATEKAAELSLDLFNDAVKVAVYTESFGGPRFMTADAIDFINNWEVERFRSAISTK